MATEISRAQKICMVTGATLCATVDVVCAILAIRKRFGQFVHREFDAYLIGCVFFSCTFVTAIVFGIWAGGTVSGVWRSSAGKVWFVVSGCGVLGSILATFGATYWMAHDGPVSQVDFRADTMIGGGIILVGTLSGLIAGYFSQHSVKISP